jgi:hypothetical protein
MLIGSNLLRELFFWDGFCYDVMKNKKGEVREKRGG